ncbi:hypothetical protein FXF36_02160 [Pseudobutyrivibrio xylanivorans]|uniref:Rpn family recombination-promoting nuclease/putative transposase n=1 Tax=Pseudobutyrivibrio xylanivorans TaxID=185007 RepID=A0A5P6VMG8_PSEXY|nr:hypothetical protein FXF36_02160 [Pseudobutyrivibrio xylanivorans]
MREAVRNDISFSQMDRETAELMSEFASLELPKKNKEGEYDMCKAVEELKEEGREEGRVEMLVSLVKDGLLNIEEAAKRAHMTVTDFEKLVNTSESN